MRISYFALTLLLLLGSCGYIIAPLNDKDIQQYIKAYENLATISPQLANERAKSNSVSILTCKECLALLDTAVKEAGYSSYRSFLATDIRIHYAMRHVLYLEIAQITAGVASDVPDEQFCSDPGSVVISDKAKTEQVEKLCGQISTIAGFIEKFARWFDGVADKLVTEGDLEVVAKYLDQIHAVQTNENLIDELNHANGGDWDD